MQHKIFPKEIMIKTMFITFPYHLIITLSHCLACKPFDINFIMFQSECNHAPMCFGYGCVVMSAQDVLELDVVPDFYFSMRNACPWASRFDSFTYWTWSLGLGFFLPCLLCEGSSRECSQILLAPWLAKCCTICKRQTSLL